MPRRITTELSDFREGQSIEGCKPRRTTVRWPEPIFAHLDHLVNTAKARTDRQELAAALISATPADRDELREALALFREGTVGQMGSREVNE